MPNYSAYLPGGIMERVRNGYSAFQGYSDSNYLKPVREGYNSAKTVISKTGNYTSGWATSLKYGVDKRLTEIQMKHPSITEGRRLSQEYFATTKLINGLVHDAIIFPFSPEGATIDAMKGFTEWQYTRGQDELGQMASAIGDKVNLQDRLTRARVSLSSGYKNLGPQLITPKESSLNPQLIQQPNAHFGRAYA